MNSANISTLDDCTEFRQTILASPPRVLHATVLLLMALLAAAFTWAGLTEADLVVRANGRVRPLADWQRPANAASEESTVAPVHGGRVVAVHIREGQRVAKGDLLIQFDDREINNDIVKHERTIALARTELDTLERMKQLIKRRFAAAEAKAAAELAQAQREIDTAQERRITDIEIAKVKLASQLDTYERLQKLRTSRAVTEQEIKKAESSYQEAVLRLQNAELPVDERKTEVASKALELVWHEYEVEVSELEMKRALKLGDVETAELDLSRLRLHLEQARLIAPSTGVVTALNVRVGDVVEAGCAALHLVDQHGLRLDIAMAADDVGMIREGMPVRVKLDAFDYQKYGTAAGRVVYVSPDSHVPKNATGNERPRYTVKVALETNQVGRGEYRATIKLGMTGQAEIITDREAVLSLLARSIRRSISLR